MERIEEKLFPNNLEDRLAILVNAVNTELKTATLLHLDDVPREGSEIRARIRETIGRGYLPCEATFREYGETLYGIAVVAKKTITRDTGEIEYLGYSLTEAGKKYALPVAVSSLKYSVDNNISMFSILGSTTSTGNTRAPYNRISILEKIRNSGELREIDLDESLNLDVSRNLEALTRIGFVGFDSTGAKPKGIYKYEWVNGGSIDSVKTVRHHLSLTKKIAEYLANNKRAFEREELGKSVAYNSLSDISKILCGLERQGCVRRILPWKAQESQSKVKILDKGRKFYDEWCLHLIEILTDQESDSFRQDFIDFTESGQYENYIKKGIELYKEVSPNINRKSLEERVREIIDLLRSKPGLTRKEIARDLKLSDRGINRYITKLKKELKTEKEGHEVRYSLSN